MTWTLSLYVAASFDMCGKTVRHGYPFALSISWSSTRKTRVLTEHHVAQNSRMTTFVLFCLLAFPLRYSTAVGSSRTSRSTSWPIRGLTQPGRMNGGGPFLNCARASSQLSQPPALAITDLVKWDGCFASKSATGVKYKRDTSYSMKQRSLPIALCQSSSSHFSS
jgi:hypothetical protein